MQMRKYLNMEKSNLEDALYQVTFLINNKRYESAFEIIQVNEISITDLEKVKSIMELAEFNEYVKKELESK